jgi:signal transduction histidine kinase
LQELASRVTKLFSVQCDFNVQTVVQMYDNAAAVHLYRIAQEAINNAIKHGQATRIDLGLTNVNNQIVLTVKDNGIGVASNGSGNGNSHKSQGMGLRVMNYRAGMIGATVLVETNPDGGTLVKCTVPNNRPAPPVKKGGKPKAPKPELAPV